MEPFYFLSADEKGIPSMNFFNRLSKKLGASIKPPLSASTIARETRMQEVIFVEVIFAFAFPSVKFYRQQLGGKSNRN